MGSPKTQWSDNWKKSCGRLCATWNKLEEVCGGLYEELIAKRPRLFLAVLTLIWLIPGSAQLPLVDRDEPRFAFATQEMIDRNSPVVPYFNGEVRFDKPPFVYWWMRLSYMFCGYGELGARMHSILATLAVVLLIYGFAKRLYSKSVGFWAGFAFLTCLQVFVHGRLCVADMPMMIFIVAAQWAMWELLQKPSWRWAAIFWAALGLGFTTKWVVPWAVVGLTFIAFFALQKKWPWKVVKNFKPVSGLLLMLAILLAWGIPAWWETSGDFFKIGIGHHVLDRGAQGLVGGRPGNPVFYILSALFSLMPWLAFAGGVAVFLRNEFGAKEKFLVAWAAVVYLLFSFSQTQLPHYVLPAFPALMILLAAATGLQKSSGTWARRFYCWTLRAWAILMALLLFLVAIFPVAEDVAVALKFSLLLIILALGALIIFPWALTKNRYFSLSVAFVAVPFLFWGTAVLLDGKAPAQQIAARFHAEGAVPETLVASGFTEPSLTAYTQSYWQIESNYAKAVAVYNQAPNSALVDLSEEFTVESAFKILLKAPLTARVDNQKMLLANPPQGGRRFRSFGVNLGRFSYVSYDLYLKP